MRTILCRWPNKSVSVVVAWSYDDVIFILDEWGAAWDQGCRFMVLDNTYQWDFNAVDIEVVGKKLRIDFGDGEDPDWMTPDELKADFKKWANENGLDTDDADALPPVCVTPRPENYKLN